MSKVVKISIFSKFSPRVWRTELVSQSKQVSHLKLSTEQIQHYIDLGAVVDVNTANFPVDNQKKTIVQPTITPSKVTPPVQPIKVDSASSTGSKVSESATVIVQDTAAKKPIEIGVSDTTKTSDR